MSEKSVNDMLDIIKSMIGNYRYEAESVRDTNPRRAVWLKGKCSALNEVLELAEDMLDIE